MKMKAQLLGTSGLQERQSQEGNVAMNEHVRGSEIYSE